MMKLDDYKLFPRGKGRMIEEIITIFDDYDNDDVKDSVIIEFMGHYQKMYEIAEYDFLNGDYTLDSKIADKIGKNRTNRLEQLLRYI